jgi:alpha-beta hydrolase superfamily lysophospholipase
METVIILHGLGRSGASMRKLAAATGAAGFQALVLDYPSTGHAIDTLADGLCPRLPPQGRLHFVGHSLGGILAKKLAKRLDPARRGRVVQIGAPNFGSELAARAGILSKVMGPALAELHPNPGEDDSALDIGAIGGTAALAAYSLITGIDGENDGKVSLRSAFGHAPEGKKLALPVAHSLMMRDQRVINAAVDFLQNGCFTP